MGKEDKLMDEKQSEQIALNKVVAEYEPFGDQWTSEMKKWSKDLLVDKIRNLLKENKLLKEVKDKKYQDLADRYNDLLLDNCD